MINVANPPREFGLTRSLGVLINTLRTGRSNWLRLGFLFVFLLLNIPFLIILIHLTTSTTTFNI